jgi:ABC-2 type transport system ATP-binding protein
MLLHTERLTKFYNRFCALDNLTLDVRAGEVFGLLGPNGSGKSTALRLLLGFLRPTAGSAAIDGHDCWHDSVAARGRVAYLPGELRLYEHMTGRQLVKFLCDLRRQPVTDAVDRLARRLDIDPDQPIKNLSSGMKRKIALLQVLTPRVPLVLLDEPTNTLDPTMRDELLAQLRRAATEQGQAVLFSSHVLSEVEHICDRVAILQRGRLVHLQDMAELRQARLVRVRLDAPPEAVQELPGAKVMAGPPRGAGPGLPEPEPDLPGVRVCGRDGDWLTLEQRGDLGPLLAWLAARPVRDVQIQPLGLGNIYHRYHGNVA